MLQDLQRDGQCRAVRKEDKVATGMAVHSTVAVPLGVRGGLGDVMDVAALDAAGQGLGASLVEGVLLLHGAPRRALAVVHAKHAGELVHVPYLEQAAARMPRHGIVRTHVPNSICTYEQIRTAENWVSSSPDAVACRVGEQAVLGRPAWQSCAKNGAVRQDNLLQQLEVVLPWGITAKTITKKARTHFS